MSSWWVPGPGEVDEGSRENRDWSSLIWAVFFGVGLSRVGEVTDGVPMPRLETDTPAAPSLVKES